MLMVTREYADKLPLVPNHLSSAESWAIKVSSGSGEFNSWAGSPFAVLLCEFVKTVRHDMVKAGDTLGQDCDDQMEAYIKQMDAIAGGASNHKNWWDGYETSTDLVTHFKKTLAKIEVQQICNLSEKLLARCEDYCMKRQPGLGQDKVLEAAAAVQMRARITQLEVVVMKTVDKSRKPADRVATLLSNFDTEEHVTGTGRVSAGSVISKPVKAFLQEQYGLLKNNE